MSTCCCSLHALSHRRSRPGAWLAKTLPHAGSSIRMPGLFVCSTVGAATAISECLKVASGALLEKRVWCQSPSSDLLGKSCSEGWDRRGLFRRPMGLVTDLRTRGKSGTNEFQSEALGCPRHVGCSYAGRSSLGRIRAFVRASDVSPQGQPNRKRQTLGGSSPKCPVAVPCIRHVPQDKPNAGYSGTPMWKIKAQLQEQQAVPGMRVLTDPVQKPGERPGWSAESSGRIQAGKPGKPENVRSCSSDSSNGALVESPP